MGSEPGEAERRKGQVRLTARREARRASDGETGVEDAPRDAAPELFIRAPIDRAVAFVAGLPSLYVVYLEIVHHGLDLPRIGLLAYGLLQLGFLVTRHRAVRITAKPAFWALAFMATYWGLAVLGLEQPGKAIIHPALSGFLSVFGVALDCSARLTLRRNIGFVPAQRRLVFGGPYRLVRHPIYSGVFVSYCAYLLAHFSPINAGLVFAGVALFVLKSLMEEHFLSQDPEYRRYAERVRWRWIPYVV